MPLRLPLMQPCMYSTGVSFRGRHRLQLSLCQSHSFMCPLASISDLRPNAASALQNNSTTWHQTPWTVVFVPWEPFQSQLCISKLMPLLRSGLVTSAACRTVFVVEFLSLFWPFCWPAGMWRTWGSEGSSPSPSGCRFWLGPDWSRTVSDSPRSPLWWLWSHGQDLPVREQRR